MSKIVEMLKQYTAYNEQEKVDVEVIIQAEEMLGDILTRENKFCHCTASAFVVNKERTKLLCGLHKIYGSWTWVGGHIDGIDDACFVAQKELKEETALKDFKLLSKSPISIENLPVASHFKKGKFVNAHIHLNITYLFEADENAEISYSEDEHGGLMWIKFEDLPKMNNEPYVLKIFEKIIRKIKEMNY